MDRKYLKPIADKSIKTNLMALVNFCRQEASSDKVAPRREAFEAVARDLEKLANGRYVTRLLDYME